MSIPLKRDFLSRRTGNTRIGIRELIAIRIRHRQQITCLSINFIYRAILRRQDIHATIGRVRRVVRIARQSSILIGITAAGDARISDRQRTRTALISGKGWDDTWRHLVHRQRTG